MTAPAKDQATEQRQVIDVSTIGCPCCGERPWCREEMAAAALAAARAPELVMGSAMYGRWSR